MVKMKYMKRCLAYFIMKQGYLMKELYEIVDELNDLVLNQGNKSEPFTIAMVSFKKH